MSDIKAILINATSMIGHHGCTLVNHQLTALAAVAGISIVARIPLDADWDTFAPYRFDMVIVNGEGTLHSNSKGARLIAQVPAWARARGIPAHLINTIYQDNPENIADRIALFDSVYARDRASLANLIADGVQAAESADLSLTWSPPRAPSLGSPRQTIVMGSTIEAVRNELHALSQHLNAAYLPILARPASDIAGGNRDRFARYYAKRFVSCVAPRGPWRTRWRSIIPDFSDFAAFLQTHASQLITGRFHGAAIVLCLEIPVMAVPSNTKKIDALFSEAGISHRLFSTVRDLQIACAAGTVPAHYTPQELQSIRALRDRARFQAAGMMATIAASAIR